MGQADAKPQPVRCRHCRTTASQRPPDWYQHGGDPEALLCDCCFKDIQSICRSEAVATYLFVEKRLIAERLGLQIGQGEETKLAAGRTA